MLKEAFEKTFDGMRGENKFLRFAAAALVVLLFAQSCANASKDEPIAIVPPTMTEKGWVSQTESSSSYTDAWVLYVGMMLGNVTPSNASIVKDALGPLLHPEIYQDVMEVLDEQIFLIRQDRVSLSFEPEKVLRDSTNENRFYVTGRSVSEGPTGDKTRTVRTYEIDFSISNYKPRIDWLATYAGSPRTPDVLAREQAMAERKSAKK
jgi:conjugal transfer pilus assembly protein TraE